MSPPGPNTGESRAPCADQGWAERTENAHLTVTVSTNSPWVFSVVRYVLVTGSPAGSPGPGRSSPGPAGPCFVDGWVRCLIVVGTMGRATSKRQMTVSNRQMTVSLPIGSQTWSAPCAPPLVTRQCHFFAAIRRTRRRPSRTRHRGPTRLPRAGRLTGLRLAPRPVRALRLPQAQTRRQQAQLRLLPGRRCRQRPSQRRRLRRTAATDARRRPS